jgi:hypothetical protein
MALPFFSMGQISPFPAIGVKLLSAFYDSPLGFLFGLFGVALSGAPSPWTEKEREDKAVLLASDVTDHGRIVYYINPISFCGTFQGTWCNSIGLEKRLSSSRSLFFLPLFLFFFIEYQP